MSPAPSTPERARAGRGADVVHATSLIVVGLRQTEHHAGTWKLQVPCLGLALICWGAMEQVISVPRTPVSSLVSKDVPAFLCRSAKHCHPLIFSPSPAAYVVPLQNTGSNRGFFSVGPDNMDSSPCPQLPRVEHIQLDFSFSTLKAVWPSP